MKRPWDQLGAQDCLEGECEERDDYNGEVEDGRKCDERGGGGGVCEVRGEGVRGERRGCEGREERV